MSAVQTGEAEQGARLASDAPWPRPRVLEGLSLDGHAIIEASAGTGKTYTLEHLVLELVVRGAPIEEILVVTFTDKATREMRQRVRARLIEARSALSARAGVDGVLLSRVSAAIAGFERASISTIHAFCQRALTEHAFVSGRPFAFEREDGRESFGRAVRQAVRAGLARGGSPGERDPGGHDAFRAAIVALAGMPRGGREGAVGRLEALLHTWMREPGEVRPAFDAAAAARALLAMPPADVLLGARWASLLSEIPSLTTRARVRDALLELATTLAPHRDALGARLASGDAVDAYAWGPALVWAASSTDPRGLETNVALLSRHLAPLGASLGPAEGAPEGSLEALGLAPVVRTLHASLGSPVPFLLAAVLPRVRAVWAREKRERGTLDFDDMLVSLRDAVVADEAVRRALRARYRHALVDEFQDTDAVQWEIFRRLFVETDGEGDAEAPRRTLTVIGDAKQAIYGFRSADVHTFEDACRTLERAGARRAVLGESYRSSAALLDALDRMMAPRASAAGSEASETPQHGLAGYTLALGAGLPTRRAVLPDGTEAPAVVVQHLVGAPELRLPLVRRAHAEAIAKEVQALLEGGLLLRDADDEPARPVRLSEIFVLTRSASEGRDVAEAFRRHGVPHAFFKQDGLFRTREAEHVLDVLRAVADRHDRDLATRALLGPFFGVPLTELPAARALDAGHPLARRLARWASLAEEGRMAALFSAMLDGAGPDGSGLSRRELYLHQGERALVNYRQIVELLLELATQRRLHVGELALELSRRIERAQGGHSGDDEDVQKLESERDAVQILTMHKSKGLEAEVVFVFGGLAKPPKRQLAPRVVHEPAPGDAASHRRVAWALADDGVGELETIVETEHGSATLRDALAAAARAEDERLHYVACTRAKRRLYLPYFGSPPRPHARRDDVSYDLPHFKGAYTVLNERLVALAEGGELTSAPFAVQTIEVGPRTRVRAPRGALPVIERSLAPELPGLPSAARARLVTRLAGFEVTSYTRMKSLARARAHGEGVHDGVDLAPSLALLAGESADERPAERGPGGARFGVLVHGVLEDLLRARVAVQDAASVEGCTAVRRRHEALGATDAERALANRLAVRALRTPIATAEIRLPDGLGAVSHRAIEMPFLFPVPERAHPALERVGDAEVGWCVERGYVRGVIDLLFEHEGRVFVLDWKTDRLLDYGPQTLRAHVEEDYRVQIALYTLAALRALARRDEGADLATLYARFGGLLYVFVRGLAPLDGEVPEGTPASSGAEGDGVLWVRPSLDEVEAWEASARREDGLLGCPLPSRRAPLAAPRPTEVSS